jgi:hypothetical protein
VDAAAGLGGASDEPRGIAAAAGEVVGFEFTSIVSAECEVRDRSEKSTDYPDLVIGGAAPTLALGVAQQGALAVGLDDLRLGWIEGTSEVQADD